jgi:hypothetical protein
MEKPKVQIENSDVMLLHVYETRSYWEHNVGFSDF